jgi:flavin-dependent dehydrogenase
MFMQNHYDVIIPGGGLAGLTLSLQLKKSKPDIKILILERRKTVAPTAAHKVGESTVELASYYLREVLGLKEYLEAHELPKHGLRFFFKSHNKEDITTRVELGPRQWLPTPSHQLDRGTLENYLMERTISLGTDFLLDAGVKDVEFGSEFHTVIYTHNGEEKKVTTRWVADATSRFSLLKRKLGFQKPMEHHVNAVWWRLKGVIDIDNWSDNNDWKTYLVSGLRYLSTVHFLDKGYWVWVIPLGSKNTSIGIVADPAIHPFDTIDTYEKAMEWLKVNEPLCYKMLEPQTPNKLDFKILKHFAHDSGRAYDGAERWGVTGEAGAFLDPFYSPGSDLISLSNTFLSDLILRELNEEDVQFRAEIYERTYLTLVERWIPIYKDKYWLMGHSQIMVIKIFWDWALYWSVPALLFTNNAFTDLRLLKQLFAAPDSLGQKFGKLHERMQQLFLDWRPYENEIFENRYIDPFDLKLLREFQEGIDVQQGDKLLDKVSGNIALLEKFAAEIFRHVSAQVNGTPYDMPVNPYTMELNKAKENAMHNDLSFVPQQDDEVTRDVETMWFYPKKQLV